MKIDYKYYCKVWMKLLVIQQLQTWWWCESGGGLFL